MQNNKYKNIGYCTCHTQLTTQHLIGNLIVCPSCGSIMFLKSDLNLSEIEELFWYPLFSHSEAIEYGEYLCYKKHGMKSRQINTLSCELINIPIIEVKDNGIKKRVCIANDSSSCIPLNTDIDKVNLSIIKRKDKTKISLGKTTNILTYNSNLLVQYKKKYGEMMQSTIKYIPYYIWKGNYKGISQTIAIDALHNISENERKCITLFHYSFLKRILYSLKIKISKYQSNNTLVGVVCNTMIMIVLLIVIGFIGGAVTLIGLIIKDLFS